MTRLLIGFLISLAIVASSGCVYRIDIDQGNRVDADKLQQLEPGMTRKQVEFLLGKAAIEDPFNAQQVHYIYYLFSGEEQTSEQKTMVLTYDSQNVLVNIEGSL